jgi:hypothetical protein
VDRLVGKCGAVDQLFDYYFGTNCNKSNNFPNLSPALQRQTAAQRAASTAGLPLPNVNRNLTVQLPLPCTMDDLVHSVLGDPTRCLP